MRFATLDCFGFLDVLFLADRLAAVLGAVCFRLGVVAVLAADFRALLRDGRALVLDGCALAEVALARFFALMVRTARVLDRAFAGGFFVFAILMSPGPRNHADQR